MSSTTYQDVIGIVGEIDDLFVERIVDSEASTSEIEEALATADGALADDPSHVDSSPRVGLVRTILEEAFDDEDDEDDDTSQMPARDLVS